ncbi:MAG TPA: F0F1 ATP synthase subunit delta [Gammaproteobacteria bacterium]|nr:F0F1 ATP synthase subunit delta [Gammaproteobacteria bacterium]
MLAETNAIARPYAKAIFAVAKEENQIAKWTEMLAFAAFIAEDLNIKAAIQHPNMTNPEIVRVFCDVGKDVFTPKAKAVLELLGEGKRFSFLPEIFRFFEVLRKADEKLIEAKVVSAIPLEEEDKNKLKTALEKRFMKKINLTCITDPLQIGGVLVRVGDFVLDGTLKGRLAKLTQAIVSSGI